MKYKMLPKVQNIRASTFIPEFVIQLTLSWKLRPGLVVEENRDIFQIVLGKFVSYTTTYYNSNRTLRKIHDAYTLIQKPARKGTLEISLENRGKTNWSKAEIEEYVTAISNSWIRSWTGYICNINRVDYYSKDLKSIVSPTSHHSNIFHDDLADDIEEELRSLLSSILLKIRSIDKTTLSNDVLRVARCHLKRLGNVINYPHDSDDDDSLHEIDAPLNRNFQFQHYVHTSKYNKTDKYSNGSKHEGPSDVSGTTYLEMLARKLLSSFNSRKGSTTLRTVLINKILTHLIAHQIFCQLIDVISDPKNIQSYIYNIFPYEQMCQDEEKQDLIGYDEHEKSNDPTFGELTQKLPFESDCDTNKSSSGPVDVPSSENNIPYPETIDLTGYKVGNEYQAEPAPTVNTEKHITIRGSGKISQALGELKYIHALK